MRLKRSGSGVVIETRRISAVTYGGRRRHLHGFDAITWRDFVPGVPGLVLRAMYGRKTTTTDHYVAIEYVTPDGRPSAILLQVHKDDYKDFVAALETILKLREADGECPELR